MNIVKEITETLYSGVSPYTDCDLHYVDHNYPHTNITANFVSTILSQIDNITYVVELGSMVGGSAKVIANYLVDNNIEKGIICIDPFTGCKNMWRLEHKDHNVFNYNFLKLESGIPTIYKRFLANIKEAGLDDIILPINTTSINGISLLKELYQEKRITNLPNCIYLDSAHEPDETFLELQKCWDILLPGGVLFGDDWRWPSVRGDVKKFCDSITDSEINHEKTIEVAKDLGLKNCSIYRGVLVEHFSAQWCIFKNK